MLSISLNVYICGFCKKRSGLSEIFEAFLKIFDECLELCLLFALGVNDLFRRAGNEVFVCKLCVLPVELLFGVCKLFSMRARSFSRSTSSAMGMNMRALSVMTDTIPSALSGSSALTSTPEA